jgi:hypothetical protein
MIESMRIESVSVPVGDQELAKSFYVDTWASNCWWTTRGGRTCAGRRWHPKAPRPRLCW